jgi:hypothetical protein
MKKMRRIAPKSYGRCMRTGVEAPCPWPRPPLTERKPDTANALRNEGQCFAVLPGSPQNESWSSLSLGHHVHPLACHVLDDAEAVAADRLDRKICLGNLELRSQPLLSCSAVPSADSPRSLRSGGRRSWTPVRLRTRNRCSDLRAELCSLRHGCRPCIPFACTCANPRGWHSVWIGSSDSCVALA